MTKLGLIFFFTLVNSFSLFSSNLLKNKLSYEFGIGTSFSNSKFTNTIVGSQSPATLYFIEKQRSHLLTPNLSANMHYNLGHNTSVSVGLSYSQFNYATIFLCLPLVAPNTIDVLGNAVRSPYLDYNRIFVTQYYSSFNIPVSISKYFKIKNSLLQASFGAGISLYQPSKQIVQESTVGGILAYDNVSLQVNVPAPTTCITPSSEVSVKWWFLQNKIGLFASLNTALVPVKSNTLNYSVNGYTQKTTIIANFNSTINMRPQFISAGVCYKLGTHTRSKNN